eukprot:SM000291S10868  [mRNA]  locus=s291:124255:126651:+ [translate_table: standard]
MLSTRRGLGVSTPSPRCFRFAWAMRMTQAFSRSSSDGASCCAASSASCARWLAKPCRTSCTVAKKQSVPMEMSVARPQRLCARRSSALRRNAGARRRDGDGEAAPPGESSPASPPRKKKSRRATAERRQQQLGYAASVQQQLQQESRESGGAGLVPLGVGAAVVAAAVIAI